MLITMKRTSLTETMIWLGTVWVLSSVVSLAASEAAAASGDNGSSAGGLDMLPFPEGKKERKKEIHRVPRLTLGYFS